MWLSINILEKKKAFNSLENTDKETISASNFVFIDSFVVSASQDAMRFPAKKLSKCIWAATPVDWVILHWYTCSADGRSLD